MATPAETLAGDILAAPLAPPEGASNAEIVRWAFAVINSHDVTALKPLWAETVEHFPGLTAIGSEEIADYFDGTFAAMPDFAIEIVALAADGDDVLVRWHATGHFTGAPFQGITATGAALEIDGNDHFVIRDGKIVSNFVTYDRLAFAQQLGMLPPDDSVPDRAMKSAFNLKTKAFSKLRRG